MSPETIAGDAGGELVAVYPQKALDVSNYQGRIDWKRVHAAGFRHAFIKASEGNSFTDGYLERNVEGCREHGIRPQLYHFAKPEQSPASNARRFLEAARGHLKVGDPVPVLDLEETGGHGPHMLWAWQHHFGGIVGDAVGATTALYSYLSFLEHALYLPPLHRPIWGAAYGHVPQAVLVGWHAWQYSSSGNVSGISGRVDLDSLRKPFPTIRREL